MDLIKLPEAARVDLRIGDCLDVLKDLPESHFHTCVTSPPYFGLRDYGADGQIGQETTPEDYVAKMVEVFRAVRRCLRDDGTLWVNLGDTYASAWPCNRRNVIGTGSLPNGKREARPPRLGPGLKEKDLIGIPWRVAFALQADGWYLRQDIIWNKPNPMPESVRDRCTKAHEYIFLLAKSPNYFFDADAIREPHASPYSRDAIAKNGGAGGERPAGNNFDKQKRYTEGEKTPATRAERAALLHPLGRNRRSVWTVTTKPFKGAHFATYPVELVEPCILAGCPKDGFVLDPFGGSGTTGLAAADLGRNATLIELNPEYGDIIRSRLEHRLKHGPDQAA